MELLLFMPKTSAGKRRSPRPEDQAHRLCPYATSTTAFQITDRESVYIASGCRRWTCEICGPRKRGQLILRIVRANPSKFITLTCRHEDGPAAQYAKMTKAAPRLWSQLRRIYGEIEYVRLHESCRDGYPHFHFLARAPWMDQKEISRRWQRMTGAHRVDIRKAHGRSTGYVAKYISKAASPEGEWSRQRVTASNHFWSPDDNEQTLLGFHHDREHPWEYVPYHFEHAGLTRIRTGLYHVHDREPGDELPPELERPTRTEGVTEP